MKAVIGLGNYGFHYANTRHNIGFLAVDELAGRHNIAIDTKGYCAQYGIGGINGREVIIAKPQTYMNLSGKTAEAINARYQLAVDEFIVIHDDIDLEPGRIKVKIGGGDSGHRGVRSLVSALGSADFHRIRIGVGRPSQGEAVSDYVLSPFEDGEREQMEQAVARGVEEVEQLL